MNRNLSRAVLGTALTAALAATPLALAPAAHSSDARAAGLGGLGGLASRQCFTDDTTSATASSAARGAGGNGPDTRGVSRAEQRQIETRTKRIVAQKRQQGQTAAAANAITSIPVYIHEMRAKNGAGDVTSSQITQQISVLNQTYGGADVNGAGRNTGVGFYLAGSNEYFNDTWHQDRSSSTYRSKTRQGGKNALNIWLVDFDYLGVATFPWDYSKQPKIDGIRVQYSSVPGGSATNYNLGETATHEAGHWLGLYHTFQGGCADPGDSVSDTPAQASPSSGCPTGRDSCTAPGLDPIHNYMDYSYDSCYTTFSAGQDSRMDQMWAAYRA